MIDELHVRNIALIEDATLVPSHGLTVITGETGAGKTALLSALKLLVGERAGSSMIREGTDQASIEGRVFLSDEDTEGTIVTRTLASDGRSRVHIDGSIGSVKELSTRIGSTVDLCGQHEHQRLLRSTDHRSILDACMENEIRDIKATYTHRWGIARAAAQDVQNIQDAGQLSSESLEQARYTLRRIEEVAPEEDEYGSILAKLPRLEHAEALLQATGQAYETLSGEEGTLSGLNMAASSLEDLANIDPSLGTAAQSLREASFIIEDVSRDMASYVNDIEYDPATLAQLQDRMSRLQELMRSWGPTMEDVFEAWDEAQRTVSAVDGFEQALAEAKKKQAMAEQDLADAAMALHEARSSFAPRFADAVTQQMARLELGTSQLVCDVELLDRDRWTVNGPDDVEFLFKPGAAMQARPLAKIASGGEISRVMLAIKVVLGTTDDADTLVFDEVDAGVGGATARSLAEVLVDLSRTHQVIVVTHLPQVAVRGQVHYIVSKSQGDHPITSLTEVTGSDREKEIARMLSGEMTRTSLEHARELLDEAMNERSAVS